MYRQIEELDGPLFEATAEMLAAIEDFARTLSQEMKHAKARMGDVKAKIERTFAELERTTSS